jgi:hypothetical protein
LLYHRKSEDLFMLDKETLKLDLRRSVLEGIRNLELPPVHDSVLDTAKSLHIVTPSEHGTVQEPFRNVPQPPWILPSPKSTPSITPIEASPFQEIEGSPDSLSVENGIGLVFPVLGETKEGRCANKTISDDVATGSNFIEDDPKTIDRMWDAFEAVMAKSPATDRSSSWTFSPQTSQLISRPIASSSAAASDTASLDIAVCPAPTCTALVPARLYHHRYSDWPQWHVRGYRDSLFSFVGAQMPQSMPDESTLARWRYDAGFESQHASNCAVVAGPAPPDTLTDWETANAVTEAQTTEDASGITAVVEDTESSTGRDSAYESASEILREDAAWSDDEWVNFDWDKDEGWDAVAAGDGFDEPETAWDQVHRLLA